MLAPLRWIKDYVDTNEDVDTIAKKMIMIGNGVEDIVRLGENIKNVVVCKITKIEKHPDADKLLVCQIDAGKYGELQIVTAAQNVFEGAYVPVALHGAELATGQIIKKGKLRGVVSEGMFCSGEELNLKESDYEGAEVHGILILKDEPEPGEDIRTILGLSGSVIDFEIGANRPDCLSIIGVAREAAAALDAKFSLPVINFTPGNNDIKDIVDVEVAAPDLCTRYIARAVGNVKIAESPDWMKQRLQEAGIRPINNIVDITNYVMLETGQPMHAFDAAEIRGKKIIVRRAVNGEKMNTLDGKEREFTDSMLLICDSEGPIGVAGIMGGENSEIKPTTTAVVFESAKFQYGNIRQTSRALGMATESSMRFSKGLDAATTKFAMERALTLVQMLAAGSVVSGEVDILSEDLFPRTVGTTVNKVNALLGTQLTAAQMKKSLEKVYIKTDVLEDKLQCSIPPFRQDIAGSADIAEEVARMYGYDNIEAAPIVGNVRGGGVSETESALDIIKNYLAGAGYNECITYSFTGETEYKKLGMQMPESVKILNPLGDDNAYMRTTLVADMLEVVSVNLNKKNNCLRLFETGRIYIPASEGALPDEYPVLCMAASGSGADFFQLKGCIENFIWLLCSAEIICRRIEKTYFHPGVSAEIYIGHEAIGEIGEVHPDVGENFDIQAKTIIAQIRIDQLLKHKKPQFKYAELPRFPAVERDIAVVVDEEIGAGDVLGIIKKAGTKRLVKTELFDVYRDAKLGENKKSLAFGLQFRAADKTMTDEETNSIMEKILRTLDKECGAKLRL
jgi:phenylalanyl-tRNA synthetase beta chain